MSKDVNAANKAKERKERFENLAVNRTRTILKTLNNLGNCSNRNNYDYSDEQVKAIFDAIIEKVAETQKKFTGSEIPKEEEFSL